MKGQVVIGEEEPNRRMHGAPSRGEANDITRSLRRSKQSVGVVATGFVVGADRSGVQHIPQMLAMHRRRGVNADMLNGEVVVRTPARSAESGSRSVVP
jgi:hypothetical protein